MARRNRHALWLAALMAVAVAAAYYPVAGYEFTNWDDDQYILENPIVLAGVSWEGVRWAFTTAHVSNWHPLTWLSHMLDCQLFGTDAGPPHVENVLFHLANTWLLFYVLARMTSAVGHSAFVAFLFALHPLHVESVAWIAERKDVLSTFFWFLGLLAYVRYVEQPGWFRYSLVVLSLALGLLAKPMLVTFPCVLLLLDLWPLGRMAGHEVAPGKRFARLVVEKLPLFCLVAASSVATLIAQQTGGAVQSLEKMPLDVRLANAAMSYGMYLVKMLWPTNLAAFYPYPITDSTSESARWQFVSQGALVALVLFAVTVWIVRLRKRCPYFLVGWLWYLGTLVPVIGILQVGAQARADRYTYVSLIGVWIAVTWGIYDWWLYSHRLEAIPSAASQDNRLRACLRAACSIALVLACLFMTRQQVSYWQDTPALFGHALEVTERNYLAHYNLGNMLHKHGLDDEAAKQYRAALEIQPRHVGAHNNLGVICFARGEVNEAIEHYRAALAVDPQSVEAYNNLGNALVQLGKPEEALAAYREAFKLRPQVPQSQLNYGDALVLAGKLPEARDQFRLSLQVDPRSAIAHYKLADVYLRMGQLADAEREFRAALDCQPNWPEAHNSLGALLLQHGHFSEAVREFDAALRVQPKLFEARVNKGYALIEQGQVIAGVAELRQALPLRPSDSPEAQRVRTEIEKYKQK
jgi:Tfp pilus assembly protein PilF